jgi:hypothetical protein
MCTAPKMPMPAPIVAPPEQQAATAADINAVRKKPGATSSIAGGTLLTGGMGAAPTATGGATLLGQ